MGRGCEREGREGCGWGVKWRARKLVGKAMTGG